MMKKVKFVGIPVRDQDKALAFWTKKVGLQIATDQPMGPGQRWIELKVPGAQTGLVLFTPPGHESRIGTFQNMSSPWTTSRRHIASSWSAAWSSCSHPRRSLGAPRRSSRTRTETLSPSATREVKLVFDTEEASLSVGYARCGDRRTRGLRSRACGKQGRRACPTTGKEPRPRTGVFHSTRPP